ncbi:PilZ domain-containing protein [Sorangium sp. So ce426]|uniref:PilZ domain-containing protein n=1 Tax=unclassified Sorangium TaxID=2621164 RepID=UPI003F5BD5C3
MDRRQGARAQVDFPVSALVDGHRHRCRAIDLSPTGMVVERAPALAGRALPAVTPFELDLGVGRPIRLRARPVWDRDNLLAVRFVVMSDADRLTIAEHLDQRAHRHQPLH